MPFSFPQRVCVLPPLIVLVLQVVAEHAGNSLLEQTSHAEREVIGMLQGTSKVQSDAGCCVSPDYQNCCGTGCTAWLEHSKCEECVIGSCPCDAWEPFETTYCAIGIDASCCANPTNGDCCGTGCTDYLKTNTCCYAQLGTVPLTGVAHADCVYGMRQYD